MSTPIGYETTLNKLLCIYRRKGHENRRFCVINRFHDLHEATQQTRLIFETEPGLVVNMHIRAHLLEIEGHFLALAEILERDFERSPRGGPPSPAPMREQLKSAAGHPLKT